MRLLITGASGLLGATALWELKDAFEVWGAYHRHAISVPQTQCFKLDLGNSNALTETLDQIRPEMILHTAAITNIDECETNRKLAYRINVEATQNLCAYAKKAKVKFVHISTDAIFNGPTGQKFCETDKPAPLNYYSETKILAEQAIREQHENHLIVRTNIYGWNYQNKQSLAEWMYFSFKEKKQIPLVYDVHYTPVLTNTLITCIRQLIEKDLSGTFHIASSRDISKLEFGELLCDTFGLSRKFIAPRSMKELGLKANRAENMALSNEKLKATLPQLELEVEKDLAEFKRLLDAGYVKRLKGVSESRTSK